jgi:hypothetical protein
LIIWNIGTVLPWSTGAGKLLLACALPDDDAVTA